MASRSRDDKTGRRLTGDERREEILAAAADVIDAQGFLPAPVDQVARAAGVSKALIYAYFPTQPALCNALLIRTLAPLAAKITRIKVRKLEPLAVACAELYFDDAAKHGVLLHILMTDHFFDCQRAPEALALRNEIWRRLLRAAHEYMPLTVHERMAVLAIALAIPEEMGRLAHRGEMTIERARELTARLVLSAVRGARASALAQGG